MENEDKTCTYKEIKSLNGIPLFVCSKCGQIASWVNLLKAHVLIVVVLLSKKKIRLVK